MTVTTTFVNDSHGLTMLADYIAQANDQYDLYQVLTVVAKIAQRIGELQSILGRMDRDSSPERFASIQHELIQHQEALGQLHICFRPIQIGTKTHYTL